MRKIALTFLVLLLSMVSCSFAPDTPQISLRDVPQVIEARTTYEMVWEVILPPSAASAAQFSLHTDDVQHRGNYGEAVSTQLGGYPDVLEGEVSVRDDGVVEVAFLIDERRPISLHYRFHVNVDGLHYWSPERVLNVVPKPAFDEEFSDSLMTEAIKHWQLF